MDLHTISTFRLNKPFSAQSNFLVTLLFYHRHRHV